MSTPEEEIRFAEAFNEFGEAAELMVEPPATAVIRGKVRRRRATRITVAAVAAFALIAPVSWALQQAATAEEQEPPVAAEESTTETSAETTPVKPDEPTLSDEPSPQIEETPAPPLLSFDDLLGTTLDLPSFMPDASMVDSACVPDNAVLQDGTERNAFDETGRVNLLEVVHAPLTEVGHDQNIVFLGCRFGEASAFQAVVIEPDGDSWVAGEQLIASKSNADSPYDIAAADAHGVLIGVAEHYACCDSNPDSFDYWIEKVTLDGDGEPVSERLGEGALPDLTVQVTATEDTAEAGVWTVSVLVVNEGSAPSDMYFLSTCGDAVAIQTDFTVTDCLDDGSTRIETIAPLGVGEEVGYTWEMTVDAEPEGSPYLQFRVEPNTVGTPGIVRDDTVEDNWGFTQFE